MTRAAVQDASPQADLWGGPAPHYLGHRERLRERAGAALAGLPDYELLELLLFRSIRRGDVKPLAKALLARFGSLPAVPGASAQELRTVGGVGEAVALDLKLVQEATLRAARAPVARRPVISSWSALLAYVKTALAHESRLRRRIIPPMSKRCSRAGTPDCARYRSTTSCIRRSSTTCSRMPDVHSP